MRLVAFNPLISGHHGEHLRYLAEAWNASDLPGELTLVTAPGFRDRHPDLTATGGALRIVEIAAGEYQDTALRPSRSHLVQAFRDWRLLRRYASRCKADHVLAMYADPFLQGPLALGTRAGCRISGIYFRPTFHYPALGTALSPKERARALRQRAACRRVMRHPEVDYIFTLDRYAAGFMGPPRSRAIALPLPEPVDVPAVPSAPVEELRSRMGVAADRVVFLLFGSLAPRKGVDELLDSLGHLPDEAARSVSIVLAGKVAKGAGDLASRAAAAAAATGVEIVLHDRFLPSDVVPDYFHAADVVLATYPRHVGSSGVLALAAAVGRPVLASDFGYVGAVTQRYRLGVAVDARFPHAIAAGLVRFTRDEPDALYDASAMAAFAAGNGHTEFGAQILDHVFSERAAIGS